MSTSKTIDFYFDFSSPYSYIAAERIEAIAAQGGRTVRYCPVLLGIVFKQMGIPPLVHIPLKGEYSIRDFVRSAHFYGLAFTFPDPFPIASQAAARATLMLRDSGSSQVGEFVRAVFRAFFVKGQDITQTEVLARIGTQLGLDGTAIAAAHGDEVWKTALKTSVEESMARKVFGAPFFFVDGEGFWGNDRLDQALRWMQTGPF